VHLEMRFMVLMLLVISRGRFDGWENVMIDVARSSALVETSKRLFSYFL